MRINAQTGEREIVEVPDRWSQKGRLAPSTARFGGLNNGYCFTDG
jgi:hypothetical protein